MTVSPFERAQPDGCLSDFALDRLLGDGGDPGDDRHLDECARCKSRFGELSRGRDRFLAAARPLRGKRRWPSSLGATVGIAASVLIAALLWWPKDQDDFRLKGGPQLSFWVKHGEQVRRGIDGETIAPNDAIRFAYTSERARHLAVLSLDPNGAAAVYYPDEAQTHLEAATTGSEVALPISTRLDDSLGLERIVALFCEQPIDLERARAQLQSTGDAPQWEGCTARRLAWRKAP